MMLLLQLSLVGFMLERLMSYDGLDKFLIIMIALEGAV